MKLCPTGPQLIAGAVISPSVKLAASVSWSTRSCHSRRMSTTSRPSPTSTTSSPLTDVRCGARARTRAKIHSRLHYCNGILTNAPMGLLNCLPCVMRSAGRLVLQFPPWASVCKLMHGFTGCQCSHASHSNSAPWHTKVSTASHLSTSPVCVLLLHQYRRELDFILLHPVVCLWITDTRMSTIGRRGFY